MFQQRVSSHDMGGVEHHISLVLVLVQSKYWSVVVQAIP